MKSYLLKRTAVLASSNLILQLMAFAYRAALTRLAGAEALGLNSLVMQIYSIVVSVCISGLSVAVTACAARLNTDTSHAKNTVMRGLFLRAALLYCLLWSCAALPIFCFRAGIAKNALGDPGSAPTLAVMLVCIFMTGLENVLKSVHLGCGLVGRCALSELIEQGVRFLLVIKLLLALEHDTLSSTVFIIMLGMTLSEFVSVGFLLTSFLICFGKRADKSSNAENDKKAFAPAFSELISTAAPASATALASTLFASAAALLLPSRLAAFGMSGSEALSLIGVMSAVAVPLTLIPMSAVAALSSVLMPEIASRTASGKSVLRLAKKAIAASAALGFVSTAALLPFAPSAAQKLFGVTAELGLFAALGLKAVVIFPQIVSVAVLNGAKKQKAVLAYAVAGELYQLVMMLLLTPVFGIYGYIAAMISGEALRLACNLSEVSKLKTGLLPQGKRGMASARA